MEVKVWEGTAGCTGNRAGGWQLAGRREGAGEAQKAQPSSAAKIPESPIQTAISKDRPGESNTSRQGLDCD